MIASERFVREDGVSVAIRNQAGEIAIRYYQPAQVMASSTPTGKQYFFDVKNGISMAWIDLKDVDNLLARRPAPCCQKPRSVYDLANQAAVDLWER